PAQASVNITVVDEDESLSARILSDACDIAVANTDDIEFVAETSSDATVHWRESVTGREGEETRFVFGDGAESGKHSIVLSAQSPTGTASDRCDVLFLAEDETREDVFPPSPIAGLAQVRPVENVDLIAVASDQGLSLIEEDSGSATFALSDIGLPSSAEINAIARRGNRLELGTSQGWYSCSIDSLTLSACNEELGAPVQDLVTLESDQNMIALALDDSLRVVDEEDSGTISWETLGVQGPHVLDSIDDTLVIGGSEGLCILDDTESLAEGELVSCSVRLSPASSLLPNEPIRALEHEGERLWIGTRSGLARWDRGTGSLVLLQNQALGGAEIRALTLGDDTLVWIATSEAVVRYDWALDSVVSFHPADWGGWSSPRALALSPAKTLVIGTNDGLFFYRGI
ncbi:MAG: hypothetical protein AAFY60_18165, partial [Myxococcota bacterium]